ncbi:hypothetical protein HC031_20510 [Planosporangium thailandense]|uniref:Lipoprotein with Yx(FWY)xxD motif n=1 Tax=Planosporangium thailandense TaxID=765197 RepID=A0ABX0Y3U4_9ACTN|nr:hypothetical protein [Planosporangium thailandense]
MRRATLAAVALATALSTAACTSPSHDPVATAAPASPQPAANVQGVLVLRVQNLPQVGTVVVDGNGYPLYRYDKDSAKPPTSNCMDDCWMKWPPVIDTGDVRIEGIDQAQVGSFIRQDPTKTRQVTIGGWPVYRYAGDAAPGQAMGQGVGNVWYAVTPQGKKAAAPPANGAAANNPGN